MPSLSEHRAAVANAIETATGLTVYATTPGTLTPPCVLLTESDPYIARITYRDAEVRYTATIVARPGDSGPVITELDDMVTQTVSGLACLFGIQVEPYATATHAAQAYLTAPITLITEWSHE